MSLRWLDVIRVDLADTAIASVWTDTLADVA
jgi:hypothetical protein